ncbi:MAG: SDR family oxidoreductase [Rhodobacteraceae bacterium]|nr:SDR family oxidoreductase [Paracoccaceae bacterium]
MSGRLNNRRALVAGGAGGIGRAICDRFSAEGADVIALDLAVAADVPGAQYFQCDITDESQVAGAVTFVDERWGALDTLVNAAGIEVEKSIEDTSLAEWNQVMAANVTGMFLVSKGCLPLLRRSRHASIVNFGSYDGFIADPKLAAYCASKGAVHALTRAMACDHGPEGIRVNAVCPGYVDTPMLESFLGSSTGTQDMRSKVERIHPTRTMGTPQDIAGLVLWLASDEARYASGQLWIMDGGLTAQVQQMQL